MKWPRPKLASVDYVNEIIKTAAFHQDRFKGHVPPHSLQSFILCFILLGTPTAQTACSTPIHDQWMWFCCKAVPFPGLVDMASHLGSNPENLPLWEREQQDFQLKRFPMHSSRHWNNGSQWKLKNVRIGNTPKVPDCVWTKQGIRQFMGWNSQNITRENPVKFKVKWKCLKAFERSEKQKC